MAEKVSVRGDDIHPLFKWLVDQSREMANKVSGDNSKTSSGNGFSGSGKLEFHKISAG